MQRKTLIVPLICVMLALVLAACGAQPSFELPSMTDEVPIGITPTPGEPIWYCDKHTVLRIVLQRCEATDTFRVSQIAVAIAKE